VDAPLQLVHTDICGPLDPISLGNNRYFITLINDFSRKLWMYILKEKFAAFTTFKHFKTPVEAESGHKLITLRFNRGGEYTSNLISRIFQAARHKEAVYYCLHTIQNGIAERKNHTILDMTRTMLKEKGPPKHFWVEAWRAQLTCSTNIPTKIMKNKTPQEAWSGYKPSVAHL